MKHIVHRLQAFVWNANGAFLIVGLALGFFGSTLFDRACESEYTFINADIGCDNTYTLRKDEYGEFRAQLSKYIYTEKQNGRILEVGVYFRDLESGPTFGINEQDDFLPASLLKVPVAFAIYELEAQSPGVLQKEIIMKQEPQSLQREQYYRPKSQLKKDTPYTVQDLLYFMLAYSDNDALLLLHTFLERYPGGREIYTSTIKNLGIISIESDGDITDSRVSVKGYASQFRQLYNASYLTSEQSEELLGILAESDFSQGLKSGVPDHIEVAHKFGERYFTNGEVQLHDCGIIYYPGNPYLLCVMSVGDNFEELSGVIKEISMQVYEEVERRRL